YDAQVIDRLRLAGARTIAMDLEFAHPTDERDDNALIEAIERARGKVVLAATEVGRHGSTGVLGGESLVRELGARAAAAIPTTDSGGKVGRLAYSFSGLGSFPVGTAETAGGRGFSAADFEHGTLPIDFAGPPGTIRSISYSKVLKGQFPAQLFRGK